ncbi:hypothetical protein SAMN04487846_0996 [Microbacterium sp. cf046]|nr:hypothetical protein SAMN04487846_0996 [Microbacterium sp. cf046]
MRRIVLFAVALVAAVLVVAVAGLPVYVFPPEGETGRADVAYVIGPPTEQRVALAEQLRADGVVEQILVSVPRSGGQSARKLSACARPEVTCETPTPFSTKGEVAMLSDFLSGDRSAKVIVITFTPHVARTRFILDKCFDGDAVVIAVEQRLRPDQWAFQYAYQTAAFVKAIVTPCADAADL